MKGDFSRDSFDPARHFSRVLMQQGRVQLDADWNEQTAILLHYIRTLATDLLGPHAGPAGALGFGLIADHTKITPDIEPDPARRSHFVERVRAGDILIGKGRYYVQGVLVENEGNVLYTEQTGYPFDDPGRIDSLRNTMALAYLDVWERHITCVEDERLREVALGGPDTCTRAQVVWQVKALPRPDNIPEADFGCDLLAPLLSRVPPRMRARTHQARPPTSLCVISPESRYRGAENQLYRVEVHRGGRAGDAAAPASFKWSRENGSVTFPIVHLSGTGATLADLGRDDCLGLRPGDWVEVVDERLALAGLPGPMAQVDAVDRDRFKVQLKWAATPGPAYTEPDAKLLRALLRRWDHQGVLEHGGALPVQERDNTPAGLAGGWIDLEDGIQVWFANEGAEYRTGDAWHIVARVLTGDIAWPHEAGPDGQPVAAAIAPHMPPHYHAPLAVLVLGDADPVRDCRCRIAPLPCLPDEA